MVRKLLTIAAFAAPVTLCGDAAAASPWTPPALLAPSADGSNGESPGPPPGPESNEPARGDEDEAGEDTAVRTVVVNTASDGLTASGRTIGPRTISTMPKRSAEDLLRLVPGMVILQHGSQGKGYQFYLRGFDAVHGSDVETRVEGIPVNEPSNIHAHGYLDLAFLIPEAIMAVDARKGSYRLDQGNFATAGSIEYRLGVPSFERGTRTSYEVGTTNRHRVAVVHAPRKGSEKTFVALEALHDDGYGDNRQAQRLSGLSQVELWSRGQTSVTALGGAYAARFGLPGTLRLDDFNSGRQGFYDAYTQDTKGESSRALLGLRAQTRKGRTRFEIGTYGKLRRLDLDENFTGNLQFVDQGDRHRQQQDAGTLGATTTVGVQVHDRVELRAIGEWQGNAIDQHEDRLLANGAPWDTSRDLDVRQNHFGIGPGIRAFPVDWLAIDGGVRFDLFHSWVRDHTQGGQEFRGTVWSLSPRLSTRFQIGPRWQLFAAYGRGFRSPEARAFTLPATPPPDVDLDRFAGGQPRMTVTDSAEVGARFAPNKLFDIGAAGFGTWIGRESIFDHVSGFNIELSGTRRLGVEADLQIHPADWADVGFDFTYVYGRFTSTGAPIPGAPPIVASMFGNLYHPTGFRAGLRWFLLGPRPLSYGATAGVVTVLDASVGYRRDWFQVDLSVDNILGLRWREGEYNYASYWDLAEPRSQIPTIHYIAGYPRSARLSLSFFF